MGSNKDAKKKIKKKLSSVEKKMGGWDGDKMNQTKKKKREKGK